MTILVNGELVLTGFVGESFWEQGFTSVQVIDALAELGSDADVTARLNSGGGYAYEGIAIYNALRAHAGKVTIFIDAIAASAASIIAMAGDEIHMRLGANMMIHDPSGVTYGTAEDHQGSLDALNRLADGMVSIYASRSGEERDAIRADMKSEIWLSGEEAVGRGYATHSEDGDTATASAFDYSIYAKAPKDLVALARQERWSFQARVPVAASPAPTEPTKKEKPPMAKTTGAGGSQPAASDQIETDTEDPKARIQAILTSDAGQANPALAQHLAFNTDLSAEAAVASLDVAADAAPKTERHGDKQRSYADRRARSQDLADPAYSSELRKDTSALSAAVDRTNSRR